MSGFFHSAQCLQGSQSCSTDQGFVLSESALLTSSPGSSDEWVSGRKRIANAHREKLLVITQVQGLSARCACLGSPTGNGQCRLLASSRDCRGWAGSPGALGADVCLWTIAWLLWELGRLTARETHTRGFGLNSKTLMHITLLKNHLQGNK